MATELARGDKEYGVGSMKLMQHKPSGRYYIIDEVLGNVALLHPRGRAGQYNLDVMEPVDLTEHDLIMECRDLASDIQTINDYLLLSKIDG